MAWLQAEESDSDPARFWSYLVDAVGRAHPIATGLKPLVVGSNGDELVVVSALVNALADCAEPLVVVVDDYHLIDDASVHRGMERLIDLCPHRVTIVLATRIDPPFRLGRLRVRGHIAEIRAADLRFATDEAAGLLGAAGRSLDRARLDVAGRHLARAESRHGVAEASTRLPCSSSNSPSGRCRAALPALGDVATRHRVGAPRLPQHREDALPGDLPQARRRRSTGRRPGRTDLHVV